MNLDAEAAGREGRLLAFSLRATKNRTIHQNFTLHCRDRRRHPAGRRVGRRRVGVDDFIRGGEGRRGGGGVRRGNGQKADWIALCRAAAAAAEDGQFVRGLRNEQVRMRRKEAKGRKDTTRGWGDRLMSLCFCRR